MQHEVCSQNEQMTKLCGLTWDLKFILLLAYLKLNRKKCEQNMEHQVRNFDDTLKHRSVADLRFPCELNETLIRKYFRSPTREISTRNFPFWSFGPVWPSHMLGSFVHLFESNKSISVVSKTTIRTQCNGEQQKLWLMMIVSNSIVSYERLLLPTDYKSNYFPFLLLWTGLNVTASCDVYIF